MQTKLKSKFPKEGNYKAGDKKKRLATKRQVKQKQNTKYKTKNIPDIRGGKRDRWLYDKQNIGKKGGKKTKAGSSEQKPHTRGELPE